MEEEKTQAPSLQPNGSEEEEKTTMVKMEIFHWMKELLYGDQTEKFCFQIDSSIQLFSETIFGYDSKFYITR